MKKLLLFLLLCSFLTSYALEYSDDKEVYITNDIKALESVQHNIYQKNIPLKTVIDLYNKMIVTIPKNNNPVYTCYKGNIGIVIEKETLIIVNVYNHKNTNGDICYD